jgi:hypothetical protein
MTSTHSDGTYTLAATPELQGLATVGPVPGDSRTEEYDRMNGTLGAAGADAIIAEIWRLTRNERYLEIEQEVRGHMVPDLQLSSIAMNHAENGVLDPAGTARQFIDTVRTEYPTQLVQDPDAIEATASQDRLKTAASN